MNFGRFIIICSGFIFLTIWARGPIRRYIILKSLKECPEYKNLAVQIRNVNAYPAERNVYKVSGEFTFLEKMTYGAKVSVDIKKCPDNTGNLESCRQFLPKFTISNICEILDQEENVLTKFTSLIEPPGKCPLNGSYKMTAIPIDAELMNYMPIGNLQSYYVTLIGEYNSKTMFCMKFYIQIRPRRS